MSDSLKSVIKSMELAKSNMIKVLGIEILILRMLYAAAKDIRNLKKYAPENAYNYDGKRRISQLFDDAANKIEALL